MGLNTPWQKFLALIRTFKCDLLTKILIPVKSPKTPLVPTIHRMLSKPLRPFQGLPQRRISHIYSHSRDSFPYGPVRQKPNVPNSAIKRQTNAGQTHGILGSSRSIHHYFYRLWFGCAKNVTNDSSLAIEKPIDSNASRTAPDVPPGANFIPCLLLRALPPIRGSLASHPFVVIVFLGQE